MRSLGERLSRLLLGTAHPGASLVTEAPAVPVREIFRRFWPYARPYRWWLLATLVFIVAGPLIDAATIWLFKLLVDTVLVPHDLGPLRQIIVAYFGLTLAGGVLSFCDDYLSTWVGERVLLSLRTDFFAHLQTLSLDFFERRPLGDILSRLTSDIASIEEFLLSGMASTISYALRIIFFAGALFYLQWQLALVSLVVVPLFWLTARAFSGRLRQVAREQRRRSGSISAVAEESLGNVMLVQAYNRQADEVARFHHHNLARFAAQLAATRIKALFGPLIDFIELAGMMVILGAGTWLLAQGTISLGGLLVFLAYLSRLYGPIRGVSRFANSLSAASASAERIIEFLDQRPAVRERPDALALPAPGRPGGAGNSRPVRPVRPVRGAVVFDHVSFCYPGGGRDAISDVTFRLEPGETIALVGRSGAGKSTLAKLLLRFYDPSAGRILLDGHDLRDLTLHSLRENVAVVLQETLVFDGTIRDNIAYGRPGATESEIVQAAKAADAHEFITALPGLHGVGGGYDAVVGQKGRRLSGGQRQRIAIARAMLRDAPILILDEPTTSLDVESGSRVLEVFHRLRRGRATIIISHNLLTVREASTILVLEDGRVAERGAHAQLLASAGSYARLYRLHHVDESVPARLPLADGAVAAAAASVRSRVQSAESRVDPASDPRDLGLRTRDAAPVPGR